MRLFEMRPAAAPGDHLRDQPPLPRRGAHALPRRRGARRAHEPHRGERPSSRCAWPTWPSSARTAPTASPRSTPSCCARRWCKDFAEMFPERFNNKTNGVTPRRWLLLANPALARLITEAIGDGWVTDLDELPQAQPAGRRRRLPRAASARPSARPRSRFADWLQRDERAGGRPGHASSTARSSASTSTSGNCSTCCTSSCCTTACATNPQLDVPPRTFFFAGKAAPAYTLAKLIIKLINNVAAVIDADPAVRGRLKVVFLPNYTVTLAERLIPASDVSEQISTAGYEASGTSNMKFMMNGALTVGTRDGATIEMAAGGRRGELLPVRPDAPSRCATAAAGTTRGGTTTTSRRRGGPGPDLRRPLQPARAGHLRADPRRAAGRRATTTCTWPT